MGKSIRKGPCACGSGKEYKKCCFLSDLDSEFARSSNIGTDHDEEELSSRILTIARLYCKNFSEYSQSEIESILELISLAWNMSFIPEEKRQDGFELLLPSLLKKFPAGSEMREFTKTMIENVIQIRESLYPEDTHLVHDYRFDWTGSEVHFIVSGIVFDRAA